MSNANKTLEITQGSVRLDPKTITAHGKERSRLATTWLASGALILLIVIYGVTAIRGMEAHELLAVIGTAFGYFAGRKQRDD